MKEKRQNGITLIALVITVIVLLILAGTAITLSINGGNLFSKTNEAATKWNTAVGKEENELNNYLEILDTYEDNSNYAPYDNPYIPTNFSHVSGTTWNAGFTIRGEEGTENAGDEFVWVPCVTDQSKVKPGDTVQTFEKHFSNLNISEIDMSNPDTEAMAYGLKDDVNNLSDESTASAIRTSVATYGGFYIAKYEAGIEGTKSNCTLIVEANYDDSATTSLSTKPLSQAGKGVWDAISYTDAIVVSTNMVNNSSTGVNSTLISAECWDTTMQWIKQTTNTDYDTNSEGKGWYDDVASWNIHTTGYYVMNNIYDMAGNVNEWTTEKYTYEGYTSPVSRGGNYGSSGLDAPAAARWHYDGQDDGGGDAREGTGFRVVMYK